MPEPTTTTTPGRGSFTPGPWSVEGDEIAAPDGASIIATVYYARPTATGADTTAANLSLIAAAPDLLDALQRLLVFADELCRDVGVSTHYPSAERARAAIRRALGATPPSSEETP